MVLALAAMTVCAALEAQSAASAPVAHKTKHRKAAASAKAAPAAVQTATAATPPAPDWPVNDKPAPPTINWDHRSLRIQAANASLLQILADVMSATGTKIEGASADQRIFGSYGPGSARDVLAQLLQGSGYNIVMTGENEAGVPREVLLSQRHSGGAAGAGPMAGRPPQPQPDDDYVDDTPQPEPEPEPQPPAPQPTPQDQQRQQLLQSGQPQPPGQQPN
jgi:hypothetical protein